MSEDKQEAIQYVLHQVRENDVKFVRLWFSDILGTLKGFTITVEELSDALRGGAGFDGAAIEGFARSDERDLYAFPDPTTFNVLPWGPSSQSVARMFCDIITPEGTPFEGDSRFVLRRNLERAAKDGFTYYVGPEVEHFYFKDSLGTEPIDREDYFGQNAGGLSTDLRRKTILTLEELGILVESSHHEAAPGQHEIDLRHTDALTMADALMTYRLVVKEIAMQNGCYATFMPKPSDGINGNGMHTHQSLFKGNNNMFFEEKGTYQLSNVAKCFIAGLMTHAREITAVTNQWVNSYKRLVPGFEAPAYVSWATVNRSDLIRVPALKTGGEEACRIEYRAPDPACNPYLAFSVMLAAGLEGIERGYELPDPVESDVYLMSEVERNGMDIRSLPGNLWEAIRITENSDLVRKALGDYVFQSFIDNKKIEWQRYNSHVSEFEVKRYLTML